MALDIMSATGSVRWPSGEPVRVRGGIATGPAVAGVIGTWKIAYDVWGDTVNLASRLEEHCEPGQFLLAEATASLVEDRFGLGPEQVVEIKGKGPTPVRALLPSAGPGRRRRDAAAHGVVVMRRLALVLTLALATAACTSSSPDDTGGAGPGTIVVGVSGAFTENQIVAEMYAQVLEDAGLPRRAAARPAVARGVAERVGSPGRST